MEGFSLTATSPQGDSKNPTDAPSFDLWFSGWGMNKYGSAAAWYAQWNDPLLNQQYANFDRPLFYWYASAHVLQHINELVKSINPVHPTRTHDVGSTTLQTEVSIYGQDDRSEERRVMKKNTTR